MANETKWMTAGQLTSICRIFTDGDNIAPADQIRDLLDSGCLADLRDANFGRMDPTEFRNRIREVCGLPPVDAKGQVKHMIDSNKYPFLPRFWKVVSHDEQGRRKLTSNGDHLYLEGRRIDFYLSPNQAAGKSVKGEKIREELKGKPVLDANVLDYLLRRPELIPESWKKDEQGRARYIFFWGTVYRNSSGDLCVRCLQWSGRRWDWGGRIDNEFSIDGPAAVLAVTA